MAHYVIYNKKDKKFVGGMFNSKKLYQVNILWVMTIYDWSYKPFNSDLLERLEKRFNLPSGSLVNHKFTDEEEHRLKSFKLSGMVFDAITDFLGYATLGIDKVEIESLANGIINQFKDKAGYDITKGEWLGNKKKD